MTVGGGGRARGTATWLADRRARVRCTECRLPGPAARRGVGSCWLGCRWLGRARSVLYPSRSRRPVVAGLAGVRARGLSARIRRRRKPPPSSATPRRNPSTTSTAFREKPRPQVLEHALIEAGTLAGRGGPEAARMAPKTKRGFRADGMSPPRRAQRPSAPLAVAPLERQRAPSTADRPHLAAIAPCRGALVVSQGLRGGVSARDLAWRLGTTAESDALCRRRGAESTRGRSRARLGS
jgi:hypothetical protein